MAESSFMGERESACPECNGRGYVVSGVAPSPVEGYESGCYEPEECSLCEGTGDRYGRGATLPMPGEPS